MTVTALGTVLIPLGIVLFAFGSGPLFWAAVVGSAFFDTSIAQLSVFTSEIRPSYYFAALFLVRQLVGLVSRRHIRTPRSLSIGLVPLLAIAFLAVVLASTLMPIVLANHIEVIPQASSVATLGAVRFAALALHKSSLTQPLYPLFLVLLFLAYRRFLVDRQLGILTLRVIVLGAVLVFSSGLLYEVLTMAGAHQALNTIYHLVSGRSTWRTAEIGLAGIPRMHSFAGEPGYTGTYFLVAFGPVMSALVSRRWSFLGSRAGTYVMLYMLLAGIVLTGSTTAYVGLLVIVVSYPLYIFGRQRAISRLLHDWVRLTTHIVLPGLLTLALLSLLPGVSPESYLVHEQVAKVATLSGSGGVRYAVSLHALQVFSQAPILGVGYGNNRSLSVSTFLLSNVGLIGTIAFYALMLAILGAGWRSSREEGTPQDIGLGALAAFGTVFTLMQFAKSESSLLFSYFWILAAVVSSNRAASTSSRANVIADTPKPETQ